MTEAVEGVQQARGGEERIAAVLNHSVGSIASQSKTGGGVSATDVLGTVFKGALGLGPLVQGLAGLFTGGSAEPEPLVKYQPLVPIRIESALWNGVSGPADYDQGGVLRPFALAPGGQWMADSDTESSVEQRTAEPAPAAQVVNVTVQAMDSRSFLDHSHEIAQAVREAMLNMNPINDVVNEL